MITLPASWPAPKNITAFTSLRHTSLPNLSLPSQYCLLDQQHGNNIIAATHNGATNDTTVNNPCSLPIADGSYTTNNNLACIIKTADCLPLFITTIAGDFVAVMHCGWRSLASGIIDNFFSLITGPINNNGVAKLNLDTSQLLCYLGPAIGPQAFEVGEEVMASFTNKHSGYLAAFTSINHSNINNNNTNNNSASGNKYLANIYQLAIINLRQYGITDQQIFSDYWCTYNQNNLFYSYRRGCNSNERMYSVIWIK